MVKKRISVGVATALLCAVLAAVTAWCGLATARAEGESDVDTIAVVATTPVKITGSKVGFILGFDTAVEMFDGDYNYVAVGGRATWEDDWFQSANGSLVKGGDPETPGTTSYVRKYCNDVIGKYVYINGVSVRDIMLAAVAHTSGINPKSGEVNGLYTAAWLNIDIRASKTGNHINFYGIDMGTPFVAALFGYEDGATTLSKPLTVTFRAGYTAMDGTVLKKSFSVTAGTDGAWGAPVEVTAADPTGTTTVGAISSPSYDTAVTEKIFWGKGGAFFTAFFGDTAAFYDADVTPQFKPESHWYWGVSAPESELDWFKTSWNSNTPQAAAESVMQKVNSQVRDKIVFADADGKNERTLGAVADAVTSVSGGERYEKFDVIVNPNDGAMYFVLSSDVAEIRDFLGWTDGKIGKDFRIVFKQGFTLPSGSTIAEDVVFIYNAESGTFARDGIVIPPLAPEKDIETPTTATMHTFHPSGNDRGLCIQFSENIRPRDTAANANVAGETWVREGFMLNGKTFGEISDYAQANGHRFDVNFEKVNQLTIWVSGDIPESEGGLRHDGDEIASSGNVVTVRASVKLPRNAPFAHENDIRFVNDGGVWTMQYTFPEIEEWEPVDVLSIANPDLADADGKVRYEVTFGAPVATKRYIHINGGTTWLRGAAAALGLEAEEVERLAYYGILDSILDKIQITVNGVTRSVREWQEADANPSNFSQGVLQIHYNQQNGLDTLQICWASKRIPEGSTTAQATDPQPLQPALDAAISVTFKQGFRTPAYQEIKEDVTFTYSGQSGAVFVREAKGTVVDTVTFEKVLYNGEKIEKGGKIVLPAGVKKMDAKLFTVLFAEGNVPYDIVGIDALEIGDNTVTITATAGEKTETFVFTAVCTEKKTENKKSGCNASGSANWTAAAIALLVVGALVACKKRKEA